jgi:hypothetical protein
MDIVGIREALHKQPFERFSLRLADGRALSVPHRDFVALHPRRIIVINEDASWSAVEPLLIASIDYESTPKKGTNGSGRRRKPPKS